MSRKAYMVHTILGVPVAAVTMKETVEQIASHIREKTFCLVATANAEMVMKARHDRELMDVLCRAELVIPDGAGILWAGEQAGLCFPERVAGADLTEELLHAARKEGWRVYFLGGAPGVAKKAVDSFVEKYGGFRVAGVHDGYFDKEEEKSLISDIIKSKADLLFVALGVPKQEKWIDRHRAELEGLTAVGVGGVFDVMAGHLTRAPLWMRNHRLEWAYRLYLQPRRIVRMAALPRFVCAVMKWKQEQRERCSCSKNR